jgi:hypothetical protein
LSAVRTTDRQGLMVTEQWLFSISVTSPVYRVHCLNCHATESRQDINYPCKLTWRYC